MKSIKITVGLTVTAELSVYDPRVHLGARQDELERAALLSLQERLVDLMYRAALDAATREGQTVGSYTIQAIETAQKA